MKKKKLIFKFLVVTNLVAVGSVILLLVEAVFDLVGFDTEALVLAINIATCSAPLWGTLFVMGFLMRRSLSARDYFFSWFPMFFIISIVAAIYIVVLWPWQY